MPVKAVQYGGRLFIFLYSNIWFAASEVCIAVRQLEKDLTQYQNRLRIQMFHQIYPNASGTMEKVLEIPSEQSRHGILATEDNEATAPRESRPCIGLAPGANAFQPYGHLVEPAVPYTVRSNC